VAVLSPALAGESDALLRRVLEGDVLPAEDVMKSHGGGAFYAHAGWDSPNKIQAVLDASGLESGAKNPVVLAVVEERESINLPEESGRVVEDDEEDFPFGSDEEDAWLDRLAGICSAAVPTAQTETTSALRRKQSSVVGGGLRSSGLGPRRDSSSAAGDSKQPPPARARSNANFFQKMLRPSQ
jgi:hypothetical protein